MTRHLSQLSGSFGDILEKPLLIYDGECEFCTDWISVWKKTTEDRVDYVSSQDLSQYLGQKMGYEVKKNFPHIPREQFEKSVVLVLRTGKVLVGAEAVFQSLAEAPHSRWGKFLSSTYRKSSIFAGVTEWGYQFVARHRKVFYWLTRLFFRI